MYILVIILPLLSFFSLASFGRFIGREGSMMLSFLLMFLSWVFSLIGVYEISVSNSLVFLNLGYWINFNLLRVDWLFFFDSLTALMLFVVITISTFVHVYSFSYMGHDPHIQRFISYLSLFTFFMIILVTAGNFFQMFLGWEGVGLASYLLISFWYTRVCAAKSSIKAMVINRIGDFGMILGLFLIYLVSGTFDYLVFFPLTPYYSTGSFNFLGLFNVPLLDLLSLFIFIGVCGKSAQIGLHVWLPDAMEGPTPVSALIHAATMVTAGVFVMVRSSIIFEFSFFTLGLVSFFGALTAFVAATIGVFQNDIKRIIAYSTCSQLGYMVLASGLSFYFISFFHLFTHAFFKALLFLGAGSIIHAMGDDQDLRRYGGLILLLPFSYTIFWVGSLALTGFPFLAGFYSKDLILELVFGSFKINSFVIGFSGLLAAFFTGFYSFKILYLTFLSYPSSYRAYLRECHEPPFYMFMPLFMLSLFSIFVGFIFVDLVASVGSGFWFNSTVFWFDNRAYFSLFYIDLFLKLLPLVLSLFGGFLAFCCYYTIMLNLQIILKLKWFFEFFNRKWYFDNVYNDYILSNITSFGYFFSVKLLDKGFLEFFGPFGLKKLVLSLSKQVSKTQTGLIYTYFLFFLFGVFFITLIAVSYNYLYVFIDPIFSLLGVYFFICYFFVFKFRNKSS